MTLVHGQCTDVGVGGYLVGGGVNVAGTTSKYGLGSENVDEYTLVTADARILTVTADGITTRDRYGNAVSTVPSSGDDDLFFALKGEDGRAACGERVLWVDWCMGVAGALHKKTRHHRQNDPISRGHY